MKKLNVFMTAVFSGIFMMSIFAQDSISKKEAAQILLSFVNDFKEDSYAEDKRIVGVEIPELSLEWTITATGKKQNDKWEVNFEKGLPNIPTYVYRIEFETF